MKWHWASTDSISNLGKDPIKHLSLNDELTSPFLCFEFLKALETSFCVGESIHRRTGWLPSHILIKNENDELIAFIPAYIKTHSYGEYVFDHSWAHAYQQHGLPYYPKLIFAIPFTPVSGPRIFKLANISNDQIVTFLADQKEAIFKQLNVSSIHLLFPNKALSNAFDTMHFYTRQSVQFNWHNKQYTDFESFLESMTARRRRSIKKERKGIAKQGVTVEKLYGKHVTKEAMNFFCLCYKQTYLKRSGHEGYLNNAFFFELLENMQDNLLLVVANKQSTIDVDSTDIVSTPIAASLFLFDQNGLYGRYWGALEDVSGLHFECCYYQGIEFCIEHNIPLFNPGTQGEHKILRGFEPTICYSNHSMAEPAFDEAVKDFLIRETPHIKEYAIQSADLLPFKDDSQ